MRIKQNFPLGGAIVPLLLSLTATLSTAAQPVVDFDKLLPRPGLYRVDMDATVTMPVGGTSVGFRQRADGATGDAVVNQFADGKRTPDRLYKGDKPVTVCVGPRLTGKAAELPAMAAIKLQACPDQSTTYTTDGFIHTANCPDNKMTLTVKKIGADTWEYTTDITMFQNAAGPDMSGVRMMAENLAKNGATAEEREQGRKALAELPEMQRKMTKGQADTIARMKEAERTAKTPEEAAMFRTGLARMTGGTPTMITTSKQRRTRIGDHCDPG